MIRAVFFDLYNTLGRFHPPREELQARALAAHGLAVETEAILRAYPLADAFMGEENERQLIRERSEAEQAVFYGRYERRLLEHAGLDISEEVALSVFRALGERGFGLFDDSIPTLKALKSRGYFLALLSNINDDIDKISASLGLTPYLQFALSSGQVGVAKPHPKFFLQALAKSGTEAGETVHVGDQYRNDVEGARGVGIHPILLDREGHSDAPQDCPRIASLTELPVLLEETPW